MFAAATTPQGGGTSGDVRVRQAVAPATFASMAPEKEWPSWWQPCPPLVPAAAVAATEVAKGHLDQTAWKSSISGFGRFEPDL